MDFNGETETGEVVKEYMLGGYREVRSGVLIFRRGPFQYLAGSYWDITDHAFGGIHFVSVRAR